MIKRRWSFLATTTLSTVAFACTDASSKNTPSTDAAVDASGATETGSFTSTGATSTATTSNPDSDSFVDASVADAAMVGDSGTDAGIVADGSVSDDAGDQAVDAAGSMDASFGDAEVFIPDGGAVLRPTELPFDAARMGDLTLPAGFTIDVFAMPGGKARMLATHSGAVYVTRPDEGDVLRLEDNDADGVAEVSTTAASGYPTVHGITFTEDTVYLATPTQLIRGTVGGDGEFANLQVLLDDLPDGGQHPLRTLGIGPDGLLYLSIGSSCDACPETNVEHATMLRLALDGSSRDIYASGLRNTIGFGWHPDTDQMWGMDNGSDWRGNELPPEELNRIEQGGDYGWPYCYANQQIDPIIPAPADTTKEAYCAATLSSVLNNQAHEAPIGMVFYAGSAFPEVYRGDAFVAMHGSWNRIPATGYKVVRVVFDNGQPTGIEDFVTGFLDASGNATFGRPAGITVDSAGALLFTDDSNGVVYRVVAVD